MICRYCGKRIRPYNLINRYRHTNFIFCQDEEEMDVKFRASETQATPLTVADIFKVIKKYV